MLLACLAWAEIMWKGGAGANMKLYLSALDGMIADDAGKNAPRNLGYCGDHSDGTVVERHSNVTDLGYTPRT